MLVECDNVLDKLVRAQVCVCKVIGLVGLVLCAIDKIVQMSLSSAACDRVAIGKKWFTGAIGSCCSESGWNKCGFTPYDIWGFFWARPTFGFQAFFWGGLRKGGF